MTEHSPAPGGLRLDRRTALAATGVAATALTAVACSSNSTAPAAASTNPAAAPDKKQDPADLAAVSDVPVGGGLIVGDTVITQPVAGTFDGFSSTCTHLGCKVNAIADGVIKCPCHGSEFHLDGTVAQGPAARPLDSKPVKVSGDRIVSG
ncbi:ubiquinol-cytochrome c reductase iron-sulfur subunit [Nocardia sp. NPDC020380]|uniref:ubiquinol-cytochrome c reductase iron-sulfur subunit n=1 Tax=Nocardia sp. NPDC020380 TaxID=3364309 RepID=UPI0037ADBEC5